MQLDPTTPVALGPLGLVLPALPEALQRARGRSVQDLLAVACSLFANDEYAHAASIYRYLLAARCRHRSVWLGLARCHEQMGQPEVAERLLQAAATLLRGQRHAGGQP